MKRYRFIVKTRYKKDQKTIKINLEKQKPTIKTDRWLLKGKRLLFRAYKF
jgi:hypothetical protein